MNSMPRHQDIRATARWLTPSSEPLVLLFVSHRWETLTHPDPDGRQLRALKLLIRKTILGLEAMMTTRTHRLELVPALTSEGSLQGYEIARRMLEFGVFGRASPSLPASEARTSIVDAFRRLGPNPNAFRSWVADRIGLWVDYCCMPQRPLVGSEVHEFRESLRSLDALVASSTVLALRVADDDYPARGWCAAEFFLGSKRSFSRSLFVDIDRLERTDDVAIPPAPSFASSGEATAIVNDAYNLDFAAFRESLEAWSQFEQPLVDAWPPDGWSAYRTLQGSGFFDRKSDPNPFRRVLDAVRDIETWLIEHWLMRDETHVTDLGAELLQRIAGTGLECSDTRDLVYLGVLLPRHGWIECFRPLFDGAFEQFLQRAPERDSDSGPLSIRVRLKPIDERLRVLFFAVTPPTAATWNSRLGQRSGRNAEERPIIEQLLAGLRDHPPEYEFVDSVKTND
ncbi:MAG TPA: hypothetical protein VGF24_02990 [Vicinamibacterales bacterium]